MSLIIFVIITLFSLHASALVVLPTPIPLDNVLRPPGPLSNPSLPDNTTNSTSLPSNVLRIHCNREYGGNLNPSSCHDVFHYLAKTDREDTFADRKTGGPADLPLPIRFLSNDGLCFVQPVLRPGAETARASSKQVGQAAYTLFQRCVIEKGMGGIADTIGGDNNLNVVIASYEPHVRCDKSPAKGPPWESCLLILSDMTTTLDRKVFGVKSQDARVEVNVPFYFKAIDARCQMEVGVTGKSTSSTWYEIWEAASALAAMCVRGRDKGGKAFGMGLRKNIFIQISDENPDLSQSAADVVNTSTTAALLGFEASGGSFA